MNTLARTGLPWWPATALDGPARRELREAMIFDYCKWDPQVGDTDVLCPTPLVLSERVWRDLAGRAEAMAAEIRFAEDAVLASPAGLCRLGLPGGLRRALALATDAPPAPGPRVMRFDFHATAGGWSVSEVNSDVPGGYVETRGLSRLFAERYPGTRSPGDPVAALVDAYRAALRAGGRIALVHATAYTDDRQAMVLLGRELEAAGFGCELIGPDNLRHGRDGRPRSAEGEEFDAVFRFFPAEWLPNLGWWSRWRDFFRPSRVPLTNPPSALVSQVKRFPLACARLGLSLPEWGRHLPDTRDPREVERDADPGAWVLKPNFGRVGEGVGLAGATAPRELEKIRRAARCRPGDWAAQRRFDAIPWSTAEGERYPCLGVYVVDGRAAGIYGRVAARPLIDSEAQDVAVLVAADPPASGTFSPAR